MKIKRFWIEVEDEKGKSYLKPVSKGEAYKILRDLRRELWLKEGVKGLQAGFEQHTGIANRL